MLEKMFLRPRDISLIYLYAHIHVYIKVFQSCVDTAALRTALRVRTWEVDAEWKANKRNEYECRKRDEENNFLDA